MGIVFDSLNQFYLHAEGEFRLFTGQGHARYPKTSL